ncbi:hypothetical protein BGW42_001028 [Actinomortierella wolfii]|nr:hypothetical protein BGW42_001028 [Actinomortierella wolfii]
MVLHSIDFKNIIKHPLIKATEYSSVHGGTLIKPAPSSASSVHSTSSVSSTTSSNSSSPAAVSSSSSLEASYTPVVLKWSRHPDDYRDLLRAYSKIRYNAPNILPEPDETQPCDWIVTKPATHGTLHEFLKTPQGEALSWMDKIRLIRGVASGLKYLHDHDILHMHLHSDNVLIENGPTALLTDFGQYARSVRGPEETLPGSPRWVSSGGTYEKNLMYTAPERILNPQKNPCTPATDVYSLGVIMLEIMVGSRSLASQFLKSSSPDTKWNLETTTPWTQHGARPSQMAMQLPTAMEGLIRKMISRDPAQRPGLIVIRSQLKEMANTSFDLHVREPINKGTTSIHLNPKKPISVITTPMVHAESSIASAGPSSAGSTVSFSQESLSQAQAHSPRSPDAAKTKRRSILRRALDMSLASTPSPPQRKQASIWLAAGKGDTKTIQSLLAQGVSVNQRDPATDYTPLLAAVAEVNPPTAIPSIAVLELLINRGAEINAVDQKTKQTVLHHLCARPDPSPAVLRFLLERGANPNAVSSSRQTPLHYLAEKAKTTSPLEPMRLLLDFGADVNLNGPVMWTPLHLLAANEKPFMDAIMLLLTRDANVNARDSNQWTPLHFIAHYNQDPALALKMLVDAGADVNVLTKRGEDLVQVLLKSKSIDRLALESFVGSTASLTQSGSTNNNNNILSNMTGTTGLGLTLGSSAGSAVSGGGSHRRNQSSLSTVSTASFGSTTTAPSSLISATETIMNSDTTTTTFAAAPILSPEEEAKEESLKKLADLIRWLIVDCGLSLEHNIGGSQADRSLEREEMVAMLMHPKCQHPLMRAVRLGMRPIVSVLLETSVAMSEPVVLDCAIHITEDMMASLMSSGPLGGSSAIGSASSVSGNTSESQPGTQQNTDKPRGAASPRRQYHQYIQGGSIASIGSIGSLGSIPSAHGSSTSTSAGLGASTSTSGAGSVGVAGMVTPKTVAAASAAASRIREIDMLLRIWRSEEGTQREELRAGVASRLAAAAAQRKLISANIPTDSGLPVAVTEGYGNGGHPRRKSGTLGRSRTNAAGRTKGEQMHQQPQQRQQGHQKQASQSRPIRRPAGPLHQHPVDLSDSSYESTQDHDDGSNISVVTIEHEMAGLMRSVTL